jgi:hypothetical protein
MEPLNTVLIRLYSLQLPISAPKGINHHSLTILEICIYDRENSLTDLTNHNNNTNESAIMAFESCKPLHHRAKPPVVRIDLTSTEPRYFGGDL